MNIGILIAANIAIVSQHYLITSRIARCPALLVNPLRPDLKQRSKRLGVVID